jgi:hypothetical protein
MKKVSMFITCILFYSCFKEPKKTENLNSFETNQKIEKISESTELDNQDKGNQKELKYSYIKTFEGKYPADHNLFETGILKTQLLKLLGEENYNLFIQNIEVQVPIELINNEYVFVSGGAPHNFGSEEACIEIDFVNDVISVGILSEYKGVLYFTEKEDKSLKRGKLNEWLSEVNKISMNKNIN